MPNWVTTEIQAPEEVIQAMVNEEGHIDFNKIIPFEVSFPWNGVSCSAETAAEKALELPLHSNALIGSLQASNRERASIAKLPEECFEQFVQMLRNFRQTGFMHDMDFARERWGTKWNACEQSLPEPGLARFDTAWSFPEPVLLKLSEMFPEAVIEVRYADEDIGSNCGTVSFQGGAVAGRDEASRWDEMSEEDQKKWSAFAYEVKGWEPDEDEE